MVDTAAGPQTRLQRVMRPLWTWATLASLLRRWGEQERGRFGLWLPVFFGSGAAIYLLLPFEPSLHFAISGGLLAAALGLASSRTKYLALGIGIWCAGFLCAAARTSIVSAPILDRTLEYTTIAGRIVSIDEAPKLVRIVINVDNIEGLQKESTPARVRVSWRGRAFDALPGDQIRITASLSPPPRPAAPGGYDFSRQLYFQRIGAVGFAYSAPQPVSSPHHRSNRNLSAQIEALRIALARRIIEKAPGDSGAIVAAVITGKRASISDSAEAAFRDSGLAHLLSISGLHMGLATGLIFFAVRAGLALIEFVALRYPIKKWAALAALGSGVAYLFVSGTAWPAQRAFLMSSIFFIAILTDRRAITLRNVAIAAIIILILTPEAVLHPGFQMSFAAVTSLVAFYEWWSTRVDPSRSFSIESRLKRYFLGIAVTDTIAAAATAPFSLYHFSRAANFGLAANLVSIPLMGFWVMPAAIMAIIVIPFGYDGMFWNAAAAGVEVMLRLGSWTTDLPGAVTVFPHWPPAALGVLAIGGSWLCLMNASWRFLGLAAIPLAAALIIIEPLPEIYFSDDGGNVGLMMETSNGGRTIAVFDRRKGRFDSEVWMELAGLNTEGLSPLKLSDVARCDDYGCVIERLDARVAVSVSALGLEDDCRRSDLVIALYFVSDKDRRGCNARLIDIKNARREGAHAIYVLSDGIRIKSVASRRGVRPWTN